VPGAPVTIADTVFQNGTYTYVSGPTVNGSGEGSVNGQITYNGLRQNQRPGLALVNGRIYIASASHGDNDPYHGWILGYDAHTLALVAAFNDTPHGGEGGIWEAGGTLAADGQGNLYVITGNGTFDTTLDANGFPIFGDYSQSVLKLAVDPNSSPTNQNINGWGLHVVDYFTPFNQDILDHGDRDVGSGGPLLLPDEAGSSDHPHLLVAAGKEGRIYLIDRDNMGHYDPLADHVVQSQALAINGSLDTPAYFNHQFYYVGGYIDFAKSFSIADAQFSPAPVSQSSDSYGFPGSTPSISANGTSNAIVWDLDRGKGLRAYDAGSYATELYTSSLAVTKFAVPTVANGHVYIGALNSLVVYGLFASATLPPAAPSGLAATAVTSGQINLTWKDNSALADEESGTTIQMSTDGVHYTTLGTVGPEATSFAATGLQAGITYTFRVTAFNNIGTSPNSNLASATTLSGIPPGGLDFSQGFAGASSQLTLNGPATVNGSALQLTDGGSNEAASVFSTSPVDISRFTTAFHFQLLNGTTPSAEGFTFTVQTVGPNALGPAGGGLGYGGTGGILHSIAVKFDLNDNGGGEGPNSTGFYSNGAAPTFSKSIGLTKTGLDLHSGHVFNVSITYANGLLTVVITDTVTQVSATQTYSVNVPNIVGASQAYVGFTASTGSLTAVQSILNWTYAPPASALVAPTNLQAAATSGTQVTLTWTENSSTETGFEIDRATDPNFTQNLAVLSAPASPAGTVTFVDSGLVTDTAYYYRVRASFPTGFSTFATVGPITIPVPPTTPSGAQAVLITATEIDLVWQDNAVNEQGYRIFRRTGSNTFSQVASLPPNTQSYNDTNLMPGTPYDYHIQAYNVSGFSDFSGTSVSTLTLAPTNLAATAGQGQISLSWTAPPAGAVSYNVYRGTSPGGEGSTPLATGLTATAFADATVAAGTTYYYQVTAVDSSGESARSAEASNALSGTPPAAPTNVMPAAGNQSVTLSWTASTGATSYNVYRGMSPGGEGNSPVATNVSTTTYTDLNLTNGTTYYYQVTAVNGNGESARSTEVSAVPTTGTAPPAPTGLVTVPNDGQVLLSWTPSSGGMSYNVYRATSPGGQGSTPLATGLPTPKYSDVAVTNGTTYYYKVTAVNASAESGPSNEESATPQATSQSVPPAPKLGATATNKGAVALNWVAILGATSYNVYRSTIPGGEGSSPLATGVTGTSFTDLTTVNGTTYYYQITAVNASGESPKSPEASATTIPAAPAQLTAMAGSTRVTLSWTAPPGAVSYNIYRGTSPGGEFGKPISTVFSSTTFTDLLLTPGTRYYYQVVAVDAGGQSLKSAEVSAVPTP
jgi:fibronectin type 3 domain-containing protein